MGNPVCFAELRTANPDAAENFYTSLFAWKKQEVMLPNKVSYAICHVGEGVPTGIMRAEPGHANRWITYIEVEDVDQKLAIASKLGAKVLVGKTQLPGFGSYAILMDPTGAEFGVWKRG
jgi:predicted enzyme related to lactoylglutathione lyase